MSIGSFVFNFTMDPGPPRVVCGMVLGEASESDEDSDVSDVGKKNKAFNFGFAEQGRQASVTNKRSPKHKLKYNTLLHHKLRKFFGFNL